MVLFDEIERTDVGPPKYSESGYEFLNRSARPESTEMRLLLQSWFHRLPEGCKPEILNRFKSTDLSNYFSAFTEIFYHELLVQNGFRVTVHPTVANGKCPDFLVEGANGERFYLEVVVVIDNETLKSPRRQSLNEIYDALDGLKPTGYTLSLHVEGFPRVPINKNKLCHDVRAWLQNVDRDALTKMVPDERYEAIARMQFEYEEDGLRLEIQAIPSGDSTYTPSKAIGARSGAAEWVGVSDAIRETLVAKGKRYGELEAPLIVGMNVMSTWCDKEHCVNALFGDLGYKAFKVGPGQYGRPVVTRITEGAWRWQDNSPRYTRMSAVLIGHNITPTGYSEVSLVMYNNPWASKPYTGILDELSRFRFMADGGIVEVERAEIPKVLRLDVLSPFGFNRRNEVLESE
jgi:hypothetical protein